MGRVEDVSQQRNKIKPRWWHFVLIGVFVVAFLGLAWWQWTRFQSGSGTFQNLGYAFQWPLFAAFVIYAYRTALHYENQRIDAENEAAQSGAEDFVYQAPQETDDQVTKIDENFLPQRRQLSVEEFNALNQPRRRQSTSEQRRDDHQVDF
ncbi:hypothetical protein AYJ05_11380 [Corynebacterium stationis]|uniref:Uncharacterized protein n=1 Tax=Corynebacterium stationis TaxID=1705 RepID=A0A177IMZ5_9CORY|nr:hypothetical protein AYJ05_11380 [Corynebacterium stationis]